VNINNYKFKAVCYYCGAESEPSEFSDIGEVYQLYLPQECECVIAPEICQFTGYVDGRQKEIFDGDVLLDEYPRHEKDSLVVVVFESGCFQLHRFPKGQDEVQGDWLNDMNGPANEGRLLDYKVIGNQWMSQEKLEEEVFYASKSLNTKENKSLNT